MPFPQSLLRLALVLLLAACPLAAWTAGTGAAPPVFSIRPVDDAWRAALPRDAAAATRAYLDRIPAESRARSNAYTEGGYWLKLWNFLLGLVIAWALLRSRASTSVRDWAGRIGGRAWLRDGLYGVFYALAGWTLSLPLTIYENFVREHAYGMATQGFGAWFGEQLIGLCISVVVMAPLVAALYAILRRAAQYWWLWGTLLATGVMTFLLVVSPVLIEPLFNTYRPLADGPVKQSILAMARANGVPADNVYEFDASRQTTRVSANVSGLLGTAQLRLNDNLLRRSSEPEIRAVMGHEIGHYVMNHIGKIVVMFGVLILAGFLFAGWAMRTLLARHGARFGLRGVDDVAALPLLAAVFSAFFFVATPVVNTIVRTQEIEADLYGLNLAREPHGEAEVLLKLVEYRKAEPGPIEEFVFFDHPSTRERIFNAMRWREQMLPPD